MSYICSAHRDSVKRIQHMDNFGRYISISKVCKNIDDYIIH